MWFGIEIISHKQNDDGIVEYYDSCPVIYISEIHPPTTTMIPIYGEAGVYGYPDGQGGTYYTRLITTLRPTPLYDEKMTYGKNIYASGSPYFHGQNREDELRKLRLLWDESGLNIEYTLKFNASRAGFWRSTGPQNG